MTSLAAPIRAHWLGPRTRDALVALVAFGLTLGLLAGAHGSSRELEPLGVVLAGAACFPLLERRRSPLGVFALTTCASAVLAARGYGFGPPFGPTFALFFVAADERTQANLRSTGLAVLALFGLHIGGAMIAHDGFPTDPVLFGTLVWGGAWLIGDQVRQRRQRLAELEERARRAERESERERRLAAAEERTRIARDLHDSAAHAVNVILVQAGAARLLQQRDPDAVNAALSTIEDVARHTITDIDALIRGLREDLPAGARGEPHAPAGLAALDALAELHRTAGMHVHVAANGASTPLAPALDQAAYRILQESLTNAARHGDGAAEVTVSYGETALALEVSNPLPAGANGGAPESGHGILGMRERAALLGGHLTAGRRGGRFRVHAELPYNGGSGA